MADQQFDYLFKIIMSGGEGVGKSCIMSRYCDNAFSESYVKTIGVDFKIHMLTLDDGTRVKLQLWDTSGSERFRTITKAYYRGAHAVVVIFDVTNQESFDHVPLWIDQANEYGPPGCKLILAGNKCDDAAARVVSQDRAAALAYEHNIRYFEISAKDSDNLSLMYTSLTSSMIEDRKQPTDRKNEEKPPAPELPIQESTAKLLDQTASDNEVLEAVGDPSMTVEYVQVIRRLFFALQEKTQENERLKAKLKNAGVRM